MEETSTVLILFTSGRMITMKNRTQKDIDKACYFLRKRKVGTINNMTIDFAKVDCISLDDLKFENKSHV